MAGHAAYKPRSWPSAAADTVGVSRNRITQQKKALEDVCVMAFLGPHDLIRRVFQSAAISAGGLALPAIVMRFLGFVYLR